MSIQIYQDLTLVFGPPSGERYENLKNTAIKTGNSFSSIYRDCMEEILSCKTKLFDGMFSTAIGEDVLINRTFLTQQFWVKRNERFEKFYLSPEDNSIEIPAIMFFPPDFTDKSGQKLDLIVELDHAEYVGAVIGRSLELDWVETRGVKFP